MLSDSRQRDEDTRIGFWTGFLAGMGALAVGQAILQVLASTP